MRQYLSALILILTLPIGELHTFFSNTKVENWIIDAYRPMPLSWNMKFAASELIIIMYFTAWVLYKPNRTNKSIVALFLCLAIVDAIMYFYNYKLKGFGMVYYGFAVLWLIVSNWKYFVKWR